MVILAGTQKKTISSKQSSTGDDSDDDQPVKKGGKTFAYSEDFQLGSIFF